MSGGRLTEEEKTSKLIDLNQAVEDLKEQSTIEKNLVTFSRVCELANQGWEKKGWNSPISEASLKSKSEKSFCKEVRDKIIAFKEERKELKLASDKKVVGDIKNKQHTIDNLLIRISELLDNEIMLQKRLKEKDQTIRRLKKEIDKD